MTDPVRRGSLFGAGLPTPPKPLTEGLLFAPHIIRKIF